MAGAPAPLQLNRDEALDGLRAIAALMIVFYHHGTDLRWPPFIALGFTGVHLFFVLSGYLISRPFLGYLVLGKPFPDLRTYFVRRFTRIYPAFLVALIFFTGMRIAFNQHPPTVGNFLRHALLVFNLGDGTEFFAINISMWSLVIEAQFYVILPLAAALVGRMSKGRGNLAATLLIVGFAATGVVSRALEYSTTPLGGVRFRLPFSFLDLFAMGMAAGYLELVCGVALRARLALRATLSFAAIVLYFGLNTWSLSRNGADWLTPKTLAYVCIYPGAVCAAMAALLLAVRARSRATIPVLTSRALAFVGTISYSMYLYHIAVGYVLLVALPKPLANWLGSHQLIYALVDLPLVVIVSYVAYRLIEEPALRWGALWRRRQPAAAV